MKFISAKSLLRVLFFVVTNFTRSYRSKSYYNGVLTIYLHKRWDNRIYIAVFCKMQLKTVNIVSLKYYDDEL